MNTYQKELSRRLKLSTITPSTYEPSESVKTSSHAAVFVDGEPFMLLGPDDDRESVRQARALTASDVFMTGVRRLGFSGTPGSVTCGTVCGAEIEWRESYSALAESESGHEETGQGDTGMLMAIILGEAQQCEALSVLMCSVTELAQIFDPSAPALGDTKSLVELAGECA